MSQRKSIPYSHESADYINHKKENLSLQISLCEDETMDTDSKCQPQFKSPHLPELSFFGQSFANQSQTPRYQKSNLFSVQQALVQKSMCKSPNKFGGFRQFIETQFVDKEMPSLNFRRLGTHNQKTNEKQTNLTSQQLATSPRILFPNQTTKLDESIDSTSLRVQDASRETSLCKRSYGSYSAKKDERISNFMNYSMSQEQKQMNCQQFEQNPFAINYSQNTSETTSPALNPDNICLNGNKYFNVEVEDFDEHGITPAFKRQKTNCDLQNGFNHLDSPKSLFHHNSKPQSFNEKLNQSAAPSNDKLGVFEHQQSPQSIISFGAQDRNSKNKFQTHFANSKIISPQLQQKTVLQHAQTDQNVNPFKSIVPIPMNDTLSESNSEKEMPDTPMVDIKSVNIVNEPQFSQPLTLRNFEINPFDNRQVKKCRYNQDFKELGKLGKDPFAFDTYIKEAYIHSALSANSDNQHIVKYFTSWIEDSNLYLVVSYFQYNSEQMELCKQSLRKYTTNQNKMRKRDKKFVENSEQFIRKVLKDICLGLQEMHKRDIVHLDIRPENILESFSGNFKIADFDLARSLKDNFEEEDIPEGDTRYLAKEITAYNDEKSISLPDLKKADIYALGMTAYELVQGQEINKENQLMQDISQGIVYYSPKQQEKFSPELLEAIKQMLNPNPQLRPSTSDIIESLLSNPEQQEIKSLKDQLVNKDQQIQELEQILKQLGYQRRDQDLSGNSSQEN